MDEQEFTAWAAGVERRLLRSTYLLTGDLQRAEDLVQEALVKVALRWDRLRDGNPTAYARTIVARDHISWWRRRRREVLRGELVDVVAVTSPAVERRLLVRRALATLTPRQRAVVVLRYFEDLTERDTAEVLGVSIGTVKSQTHLALRRLREAAPELAEFLHEESR